MELAFSDRRQELSGTIVGASGTPAAEYTIVVFPEDNRFWLPGNRRIKSTRPSTDGRFAFDDLPAGDYRIAALTDVEPGEWQDPDFLRQLLGASIAVTVRAGEKTVHDLKAVR